MTRQPTPVLIFLVFGAAVAAACDSSDPDCVDDCDTDGSGPRIISASAATVIESEAHLAVAPDGETLAAVWTARTGADWLDAGHIGYAFSDDGGETWSEPGMIGFPDRDRQVNVKVVADQDGGFAIVWLGRSFSEAPDAIVVARAPAGSREFESAVEVTAPGAGLAYDLPAIASHRGVLIAAYNQQDPADECFANAIARSDDDGQTWTQVVASPCSPAESLQNINAICADEASDRIWLAYVIGTPEEGLRVEARSSDDGGLTWPDADVVRVSADSELVAFDPMFCVADADGMSVAYGTTTDPLVPGIFGKLEKVRVARVDNAGTVAAVDGLDPADRFALHPQLVRDGSELHLLYLAGSEDGDADGSIRRIRVADGERSELVHGPIRFEQTWGVPGFLGDYFGAVWAGDSLAVAHPVQEGAAEVHIAFKRLE
jgi:hypothetical protein